MATTKPCVVKLKRLAVGSKKNVGFSAKPVQKLPMVVASSTTRPASRSCITIKRKNPDGKFILVSDSGRGEPKEKEDPVEPMRTKAEKKIAPMPRDPLDDLFDDEALNSLPGVTVE